MDVAGVAVLLEFPGRPWLDTGGELREPGHVVGGVVGEKIGELRRADLLGHVLLGQIRGVRVEPSQDHAGRHTADIREVVQEGMDAVEVVDPLPVFLITLLAVLVGIPHRELGVSRDRGGGDVIGLVIAVLAGGVPVGRGLDDPLAVPRVGVLRRGGLVLEDVESLMVEAGASRPRVADRDRQEREPVGVGPLPHPPLVILEAVVSVVQVDVVIITGQRAGRVGHAVAPNALLLYFPEGGERLLSLLAVVGCFVPPDDEDPLRPVVAGVGVRKGRLDLIGAVIRRGNGRGHGRCNGRCIHPRAGCLGCRHGCGKQERQQECSRMESDDGRDGVHLFGQIKPSQGMRGSIFLPPLSPHPPLPP